MSRVKKFSIGLSRVFFYSYLGFSMFFLWVEQISFHKSVISKVEIFNVVNVGRIFSNWRMGGSGHDGLILDRVALGGFGGGLEHRWESEKMGVPSGQKCTS